MVSTKEVNMMRQKSPKSQKTEKEEINEQKEVHHGH